MPQTDSGVGRLLSMTDLDLQILEELGLKRYIASSYFPYLFCTSSRSNLAKRLKKMLGNRWIGRTNALEPLSQKIEFVYFLKKKGAEQLMVRSLKFACIDEIDIPHGYSTITHDLGTGILGALIMRDKEPYVHTGVIQEIEYEARRTMLFTQFSKENFLPDAVLKISYRDQRLKTFLIEIDNSTENKKMLRKKISEYQHYLQHHKVYLLFVIIQHSEKRLALVLQIAGQVISKDNNVFVCTAPKRPQKSKIDK